MKFIKSNMTTYLSSIFLTVVFMMAESGMATSIIDSGITEDENPVTGQVFYRTDTHVYEIYDGQHWIRQDMGVYNVKAYGAIGDGFADDTTAIGNAINAASEGETIFFPSGTYMVTTLVINKCVNLMGFGSWGMPLGGAVIKSITPSVPVIYYSPAATSGIKLSNIRVEANLYSTCCVDINTAHNGFELNRVFLKGNNCPTGLIVENGSWLCLNDIYTTGFSDANITNKGVARLIIDKGLHDVGANAFVYVSGANGGTLLIKDTYVEITSGSKDIVKLNNNGSPTTVNIENLGQTCISPISMIRNIANVSSPVFKLMNYRGISPTYLYKDDNAPSRNILFNSTLHSGLVLHKNIVSEYPITISTFNNGDITPSVAGGNVFKTANITATTINMFDDGYTGKEIKVIFCDSNTTIDFSGTNLKGNGGVDWHPVQNDYMTCVFDGTYWYCK